MKDLLTDFIVVDADFTKKIIYSDQVTFILLILLVVKKLQVLK